MASLPSSTSTSTPTSQPAPTTQPLVNIPQPTQPPPQPPTNIPQPTQPPPQPPQGQPHTPTGDVQTPNNNNNNSNNNNNNSSGGSSSSSSGTTRFLQKNPPLPEPKSQQQYVQFRKKGVVVLTQLLANDESEWKVIEDKLIHRERIEKTKHLKHLIRRSDIPHQLRGLFWLNVSGADQLLYKNQSVYWHYVDKMYEEISTREAKIKKIREQRAKEKREKKKMLQELLATVKEDPTCEVQSPTADAEKGSEGGSGSSGASNNTESSSATGGEDRKSKRKEEIWADDEVEDEATEKADKEAETGWMSEEEKQMMAIEKQIEKDLMRTGMDNEWIRSETGVTKLRRLLLVYSRQNRHVGYCQAMHMLAAHFLLQMEEEKAFWMLTNTIESILPKDYYTEAMTGIRIEIGTFNEILRRFNPRILQHITSMGIILDVFLTHWFLSLFINVLPDPTIIRVFDLFFFEGSNIIFRVVLGLLKIHEKEILGCTDPGKMMILLRDMPSNVSYGELSDAMFSFKIIEKSKIESIKAVYTVKFAKENNIQLDAPPQQKKQPQQQQPQQSPLRTKLWSKKTAPASPPPPEENPAEPKKKFQFKQQQPSQQPSQQPAPPQIQQQHKQPTPQAQPQSPVIIRSGRKQTSRPRALIIQTDDKNSLNKLIDSALSGNQSEQQKLEEEKLSWGRKTTEGGSYVDPLGGITVSQPKKEEAKEKDEIKKSEEKVNIVENPQNPPEPQIKEITLSIECESIPVLVSKAPPKSISKSQSLAQSETLPEAKPKPTEVKTTPEMTSNAPSFPEPEMTTAPEEKLPLTPPVQITTGAKPEPAPQIKIADEPLPQTKQEPTPKTIPKEDLVPQIKAEPKHQAEHIPEVPQIRTNSEPKHQTEHIPEVPQIRADPEPKTEIKIVPTKINAPSEPKPALKPTNAKEEQKPQIKTTGTVASQEKTIPVSIKAKSEYQRKTITTKHQTKATPMTAKRVSSTPAAKIASSTPHFKAAKMTTKNSQLTPQSKTKATPTTKSPLATPQTKGAPIVTKTSVPGKKVPYITTTKSTPTTMGPRYKTATGATLAGTTSFKTQRKTNITTAHSKVQTKTSTFNSSRSVSATAKMFGTMQTTKKAQTGRERPHIQHSSATMQTFRQMDEFNKQCSREDQTFNRKIELYEEFSKIRASYADSTK